MYAVFLAISAVLSMFGQLISLLWIIFVILARWRGYGLYTIHNDEGSFILNKLIRSDESESCLNLWFWSFSMTHDKKPNGLFLGRFKDNSFYVGEITQGISTDGKMPQISIWIIAKKGNADKLLEKANAIEPKTEDDKKNIIEYMEQCGHGYYFTYNTSKFIYSLKMSENQKIIVDEILSIYFERKSCTVLISGPPATGKSSISKFLARELHGAKIVQYNPLQVGGTLGSWYSAANPSAESPIILLMDECDICISCLAKGTFEPHKEIVGQLTNKNSWNSMLDKIDSGIYPHLILFLTSNYSKELICSKLPRLDEDKIDSSWLREGRVHYYGILDKEPDVLSESESECEIETENVSNVTDDETSI